MEEDRAFSILERYGDNFTDRKYLANPAIGRDEQIKELILVLLTPEKSAVLIGKPGVGKTAVVEGLAYRIQNNDVPNLLKGYTIINIKTASLLGTMPNGESKVQLMIDELKEKENIILFIDEIHMLIGATDSSSLDFANIFKEGLGRGSIKVIGATTTEEYERYILRDKAFTRRFQKVNIEEPTREETIEIMMGSLPKIEKTTGVTLKYTNFIKENIMAFLVDLTSEYKRVFEIGSRYPDISLTLLKQAFSYAIFDNLREVNIFHIQKAIENTKNVYPDVLKKEIPKFLEIFKDIIAEEKGIDVSWTYKPKTYEIPVEKIEEPKITIEREEVKESIVEQEDNIDIDEYDAVMPKHENSLSLDSKLIGGNLSSIDNNNETNELEQLLNVAPVPIDENEFINKKEIVNKNENIAIDLDLNSYDDNDDNYFE